MKLTKALRDRIVTDAVNTLLPLTHTQESWKQMADDLLYPYLRTVIDPKVLAVWDDEKLKNHLHRDREVRVALKPVNANGSFDWYDYPSHRRFYMTEYLPTCENFFMITYEAAPDISMLVANKHMSEQIEAETRSQFRSRLTAAIASCNTTAQLAEILPELIRFIPAEASPLPVPVAVYNTLRHDLQMLSEGSAE